MAPLYANLHTNFLITRIEYLELSLRTSTTTTHREPSSIVSHVVAHGFAGAMAPTAIVKREIFFAEEETPREGLCVILTLLRGSSFDFFTASKSNTQVSVTLCGIPCPTLVVAASEPLPSALSTTRLSIPAGASDFADGSNNTLLAAANWRTHFARILLQRSVHLMQYFPFDEMQVSTPRRWTLWLAQ